MQFVCNDKFGVTWCFSRLSERKILVLHNFDYITIPLEANIMEIDSTNLLSGNKDGTLFYVINV